MPLCLRSSQSHNKSTGRCAETQPVSRFILTPDATVTNTQPAFHLRELPSGGRQTSPEPRCVCSSHPHRDVSLTHSPAGPVYQLCPAEACSELIEKKLKVIMAHTHCRVPVHGRQSWHHSTGSCSLSEQAK